MTGQLDELFAYSFQSMWVTVTSVLPQILIALLVLIVGWIIGSALKAGTERLFAALRINSLLDAAGVDVIANRAGYPLNAGKFVGSLVKWFFLIVFFVMALDIVGLSEATSFFRDAVLSYLPKVIVSVVILFGALIVANVVDNATRAAATAAGFGSAAMLGRFARYAIMIFAVLAALNQLEIAPELVQMLFGGFVFATSLALGLAFGLGGRETASRYVEKATSVRGRGNLPQ